METVERPVDLIPPAVRACSQCGRDNLDELIAGIPFLGFWAAGNDLLCDPCMRRLIKESRDGSCR